jgi:hypothetical protein
MAKQISKLSPEFNTATTNAVSITKKEIQAAAKAHKVKIKVDQVLYASIEKTVIVHAPIAGIENYKDSDFAAGVPIQLLIIKSADKTKIPSGSYIVKVQYHPGATSGKVNFTNLNGTVIIDGNLIIRTLQQSDALFPGAYPEPNPKPGPVMIPVVTSTHIYRNGKWYVDCAGWTPFRIIYFWVNYSDM